MRPQAERSVSGWLLLGGLGLLALARAALSSDAEPTELPPSGLDAQELDVLALARMLASETDDAQARVVVGWITVHAARTWRLSLYRLLTGKSGQFGPQKFFFPDGSKEIRYASTAKRPTSETLRIARGLLDGSIQTPEILERTQPTAYVEMGKASKQLGPDGKPLQPEYTPEKILAKQSSYGGIVGRLHNWFLYAKGAKPISSIDEAISV